MDGAVVRAVHADLATMEGVDQLYDAARELGRPVKILIANAGRGLGQGFLDQDFEEAKRVVDTNIVGAIYLVQKVGRDMREANRGKILITGSIAGFMPGSFHAVYNGTKAFVNSFAFALRNQLKHTDITVICCRARPKRASSNELICSIPKSVAGERRFSRCRENRLGRDDAG